MRFVKIPFGFSIALVSLVACGGTQQTVTPTEQPGAVTASAQSGAVDCSMELALQCPNGLTDGCLLRTASGETVTTHHVCVSAADPGGPPCSQELAMRCLGGLVDACMTEPPRSTMHVCVQL